nr:hypothetical protein Iba_chr06cCG12310 [Ipomoea batatas]
MTLTLKGTPGVSEVVRASLTGVLHGAPDTSMPATDAVPTSVQSADSSHGGSTQVASSQVDAPLIVPGQATAVAVPLRRSQRSQ